MTNNFNIRYFAMCLWSLIVPFCLLKGEGLLGLVESPMFPLQCGRIGWQVMRVDGCNNITSQNYYLYISHHTNTTFPLRGTRIPSIKEQEQAACLARHSIPCRFSRSPPSTTLSNFAKTFASSNLTQEIGWRRQSGTHKDCGRNLVADPTTKHSNRKVHHWAIYYFNLTLAALQE